MTTTIAWIDDDIGIIEPVVELLIDAGYIIKRYHTAAEAQENWREIASANLLLLDMLVRPGRPNANMGTYPGLYLLKEFRNKHNIQIPVVVLSVVSPEELETELASLNVANTLRKPIRPLALKEAVEQALKNET